MQKIKMLLLSLLLFVCTQAQATIYAVVVGVSNYAHIRGLRYCDDDAREFYQYLRGEEGLRIPASQVTLLLDEEASNENILRAMYQQFAKATAEDVVILYFSGHGDRGYFCSYNTERSGVGGTLLHSDVKKAFQSSEASIKLCFADACHAGTMFQPQKQGLVFQSATAADFDTQVAVFMSCRSDETSLESGETQRGVFTYYLMKGLKGRADANGDRQISIAELFAYTSKNVRHYGETQAGGHAQNPTLTGRFSANMILVKLR